MRVLLLTATAMVAFAGNSVLCRLALVDSGVDPASFTVVRLLAAAATLSIILLVRGERPTVGMTAGSWRSAVTLMAYAVAFSWAYVRLDAATGALILFGTVQCTMIVAGLLGGERPGGSELAGWLLAAAGLIWLLLPGSAAPSLTGTVLMAIAGIGWGLYSLYGRGETRPVLATAGNFLRVLPFCLPLAAYAVAAGELTVRGFIVATIAGSLTTGIGYVLWYAALPSLSALRAALVQLSVPAIATLGGLVLINEQPSTRLLVAGLAILGGIGFATWQAPARRN